MANTRAAFLESKFIAPRMPRHYFPQIKLESISKHAPSYRVVCIIAPAGYGKSTLMAQQNTVLRENGIKTCWINLDESDNDPNRFVACLISALQRVSPHVGGYAASQEGPKDETSLRAVVHALCNDLHEENTPITLFLDDAHLISHSEVHDILNVLISNGGPQMRFYLASRTHLPLQITKLQLAQELNILDKSQLAIARQDVSSFIESVSGLRLSEGDIDKIYKRTEGWVGGLQWAALALTNAPDASAVVRNFSGSSQSIKNYLSEVILSQLPPTLSDFLIRSSIFEKFSAPLCQAALGEEHAGAMIEEIQQRDLFLISLDLQNEWFRYHHLFSEFLRSRFELLYPGKANDYFRAASKWFLEKNLIGEAIRHELKGSDFDAANSLIAKHGLNLVHTHQEQYTTVLQWIEQLPADCLEKNPASLLTRAYCNILLQRAKEATIDLDRVCALLPMLKEMGPSKEMDPDFLERNLLINQSSVSLIEGRYNDLEKETQNWLRRWAHIDQHGAAHMFCSAGNCALHQQFYDSARHRLSIARELFDKSGLRYGIPWVDTVISLVEMETGNFREADAVLSKSHADSVSNFGQGFYGNTVFDIYQGRVYYEQNKLDTAEALLERALPFANGNAVIDCSLWAYVIQSRLFETRGRLDEAASVLKKGIAYSERMEFEHLRMPLKAEYVRLMLSTGDIGNALAEAQTMGITSDSIEFVSSHNPKFSDVCISIVNIRLEIALGCTGRTQHKLGALIAETTRQGRKDWTLRLLILRSILEYKSGKVEEALRTLNSALAIGEAGGYCRSFVDEGKIVGELLEKYLVRRTQYRASNSSESLDQYADQVRNAFLDPSTNILAQSASPRQEGISATEDGDQLSERQIQILRLADGGFSNREIADQLFISEATVKWHLHHIYMKLGVKNRSGAVAKLRKKPPAVD